MDIFNFILKVEYFKKKKEWKEKRRKESLSFVGEGINLLCFI